MTDKTTDNAMSDTAFVPSGYDPARAQAAFVRFSPVAQSLPSNAVDRLNLDPDDAVLRAIRVGAIANRPEVFERFSALVPAGFKMSHVLDLSDLGWAFYHSRIVWRQKEVTISEAKLPVELANQATTQRNRMLKLVTYYLDDHPVEAAEIEDIRSGSGYMDLIKDLERLASMIDRHTPLLSTDTKYYLPQDPDTARELAATMMKKLSEGLAPEQRDHTDLVARIFTLLRKSYNEVRAAAQWLFREEPELLAEFPTLRGGGSNSGGTASKTSTNTSTTTAVQDSKSPPTSSPVT